MSLLPWQEEDVPSSSTDSVMSSESASLSLSYHTPSDVSTNTNCSNIPSITVSNNRGKQEVNHLVKNLASQMLNNVKKAKNCQVESESKTLLNPTSRRSSIYMQYFTELDLNAKGRKQVSCNLCGGKIVSYHNISTHMRMYHLPEEECTTCGQEVPAVDIPEHKRQCGAPTKLTKTKKKAAGAQSINRGEEHSEIISELKTEKGEAEYIKPKEEPVVVENKSNNELETEEYFRVKLEQKEVLPTNTDSSTASISSKVQESLSTVTMKYQNRSFGLMLKQGKPVRKMMKRLSRKLGIELGSLDFTNRGRSLNGDERVEDLDGEVVLVTKNT